MKCCFFHSLIHCYLSKLIPVGFLIISLESPSTIRPWLSQITRSLFTTFVTGLLFSTISLIIDNPLNSGALWQVYWLIIPRRHKTIGTYSPPLIVTFYIWNIFGFSAPTGREEQVNTTQEVFSTHLQNEFRQTVDRRS